MSVDLTSESPEALWTLCTEQERAGLYAEARATLRAFIAVSPEHWFAYQYLAHLYALESDFAGAGQAFATGVEAFPACHELIAEYGKFQAGIPGGDLAQAETLFLTAIKLSPYCKDYSVRLLEVRQRLRAAAETAPADLQRA